MKRVCCALLALAFALGCAAPGAARAETVRWIGAMEEPTERLNLRVKPDGEVLGQYFAGTRVTVLTFDVTGEPDPDERWAKIRVGERTGVVHQRYLVDEPDAEQTRGLLIPWEGDTVPVMNAAWDVYMTLPGGSVVDVLGTVTDAFDGVPEPAVHISVNTPDGPFTGYVDVRELAWAEKRPPVGNVRHLAAMDALAVRREADESSPAVCELYPGTKVYMLFDCRRDTRGWYHVRAGHQVGYADDHCVTADFDFRPRYRPRPGVLRDAQAPVTGSTHKTVYREDPLLIIGQSRPLRAAPKYLCLCGGWDETGETRDLHLLDRPDAAGNAVGRLRSRDRKAPGGRPAVRPRRRRRAPADDREGRRKADLARRLRRLDRRGAGRGDGAAFRPVRRLPDRGQRVAQGLAGARADLRVSAGRRGGVRPGAVPARRLRHRRMNQRPAVDGAMIKPRPAFPRSGRAAGGFRFRAGRALSFPRFCFGPVPRFLLQPVICYNLEFRWTFCLFCGIVKGGQTAQRRDRLWSARII